MGLKVGASLEGSKEGLYKSNRESKRYTITGLPPLFLFKSHKQTNTTVTGAADGAAVGAKVGKALLGFSVAGAEVTG